jgi:ubiquinone/menaquinone biosynthesis C-methylase UbiE
MFFFDRLFKRNTRVCPPGACFTFDNSLRRAFQNPRKILAPFDLGGKRVVDIGPGRGYFTIPMARMVGDAGRVIAVDIQPAMLKGLIKRARKAGVSERIRTQLSRPDGLGISEAADFVLMFWMAHEVPDQQGLFREVRAMLKPEGRVLLVEPRLHVTGPMFEKTLAAAGAAGLKVREEPRISFSRAVVLEA